MYYLLVSLGLISCFHILACIFFKVFPLVSFGLGKYYMVCSTDIHIVMALLHTAVGTPQEAVDQLMAQAADKAGVDLQQDLQEATPAKTKVGPTEQEEEAFTERLRALRN